MRDDVNSVRRPLCVSSPLASAIPAPGYSDSDLFYEANGSYNLIGNCNEWTGAALRHAGVRMGLWTPLAGSVLDHLE